MNQAMDRREFLKVGGGAAGGLVLASFSGGPYAFSSGKGGKPLRLGVIGTGNRGRSLLSNVLLMPGVTFPALCDNASSDRTWSRSFAALSN